TAQRLCGRIDERRRRLAPGHVSFHLDHPAAERFHRRHGLLDALAVAEPVEREIRAVTRALDGSAPADAARCACDQYVLAFEKHVGASGAAVYWRVRIFRA